MTEQKVYYLIKRINKQTGRVDYQKCKCLEIFTNEKERCWRFSKQGAKQIVARYEAFEKQKKRGFYDWEIEPTTERRTVWD